MSIYEYLMQVIEKRGAGYIVLIDPDKGDASQHRDIAQTASECGADAIFVGGSLLLNAGFDTIVQTVKSAVSIPVIIFPGNSMQISQYADAILFLSLISGRDPHYLIGEQVRAAPVIRHLGIEPISTGYMLIESGQMTSAEFMSNTRPIPREKLDIAQATALAAEYLGMRLVYLEAGSGARQPVLPEMIRSVADFVSTPIITGGGIRTPEDAASRVEAGAAFIVTGNILEHSPNGKLMCEFSDAIHKRK